MDNCRVSLRKDRPGTSLSILATVRSEYLVVRLPRLGSLSLSLQECFIVTWSAFLGLHIHSYSAHEHILILVNWVLVSAKLCFKPFACTLLTLLVVTTVLQDTCTVLYWCNSWGHRRTKRCQVVVTVPQTVKLELGSNPGSVATEPCSQPLHCTTSFRET